MNTATPAIEAQEDKTLVTLNSITTREDLVRSAIGPALAFSEDAGLPVTMIKRMLDVGALDEVAIPRFASFAAWLRPHVANHLKREPTVQELLMTAYDITAASDEPERLGWAALEPCTSWTVRVADCCGQRLELARQHYEMLHGVAPHDAATLWQHDERINANEWRSIGSMIEQVIQTEKIRAFRGGVELMLSSDPEEIEWRTEWLRYNNKPGGNLEPIEDGLGQFLPLGDFPVRFSKDNRTPEFSDVMWCRALAEVLDSLLAESFDTFIQVSNTLHERHGEWIRETVLLQDKEVQEMRAKALDLMIPSWR
ncbi:hypothetical protein ACIFOC_00485 [Leucobacter aridicollis]|uniref:hypothetical protein n=1 Tax=Leucobacter aridicollis TaxID=283878 RepID=UPI0037C72EF6